MYSQVTCIALSRSRDAVPGTTRLPMALPILPDVIGLPPIAEFIRENGLLPILKKLMIMLVVIDWLNYCRKNDRIWAISWIFCIALTRRCSCSYSRLCMSVSRFGSIVLSTLIYKNYEYINLYRQKSKRSAMKIYQSFM